MRLILVLAICLTASCSSQNRPLQLISGSGPIYPAEAKASDVEGFVTLKYDVTTAGMVVNIEVVAAEPPGVFDQAAIAALKSWRFNPARRDGQAIVSENRVSTITFKTGSTDDYDDY